MIILLERQLIKVSICLWLKMSFGKLRIEENFFNLIEVIYKTPIADTMEILKAFLLRSGIRQVWELSPFLVSLMLEVLISVERKEKLLKETNKTAINPKVLQIDIRINEFNKVVFVKLI